MILGREGILLGKDNIQQRRRLLLKDLAISGTMKHGSRMAHDNTTIRRRGVSVQKVLTANNITKPKIPIGATVTTFP